MKVMINKCIIFITITLVSHYASAQSPTRRPNIVFILADDGDIGVNGQKLIKTPNIDKLAKDGIVFNQFYAGTTVCAPSRSALLTGLHTGHTYIRGNFAVKPEAEQPLADSIYAAVCLDNKPNLFEMTCKLFKLSFGLLSIKSDA